MPKGKGKRKAQPPVPPSSEQQAQAEGLVLRVADNKTGYAGVHLHTTGKPYEAKGRRGGKQVSLGTFATAEEAAMCVARSPEGQAAAVAAVAAAALPLSRHQKRHQKDRARKAELARRSPEGQVAAVAAAAAAVAAAAAAVEGATEPLPLL